MNWKELMFRKGQVRVGVVGIVIASVLLNIIRLYEVVNSNTRCTKVFLDLGSNIGDAIEMFMYPEGLDGKPWGPQIANSPLVAAIQGHGWEAKDFCIFGFEGNPVHTKTLQSIVSRHRRNAKRLEVFTETLVSTEDGSATLYTDGNEEKAFWGASMLLGHRGVDQGKKGGVRVRSINFRNFIKRLVAEGTEGSRPPLIVIKMDIEGAEYQILPYLNETGSLCRDISFLFLEDHAWLFKDEEGERFRQYDGALRRLADNPGCRMKLFTGMATMNVKSGG
uniref:Methyltransferase FkbM domain-containing protein n=1 Tax=Compsopogon caeruleus TaxID=31354 RepID=A0A7S1X8Z1_9RHOD|mmetsp:Transcript_10115/g.20453  ORF Transcript_10115/g.20453 Transcript_10115/m.20453 type:complete len:278 (+) Transcript_10115:93-926(+)